MISPERSHELLRAYTATRCGTAFRELVAGWTSMVYATALRVARGQETLAEDITQTVFSRLAAAPEKVKDARALGAWLHAAATGLPWIPPPEAAGGAGRRLEHLFAHRNLLPPGRDCGTTPRKSMAPSASSRRRQPASHCLLAEQDGADRTNFGLSMTPRQSA